MTIDEAFGELVVRPGWYKPSRYDRVRACKHKRDFMAGALPYEIKREYLEAAGFRLTVPEKWKPSAEPKPRKRTERLFPGYSRRK